MKRVFPVVSAIIIGILLAKFMFNQYKYDTKLDTVFNNGTKVYFIQQGVYSSFESMQTSLASFTYYIYTLDSDKYYAYIAITKSPENSEKLKGYYSNLGYTIYVKELNVNNTDFLSLLEQYDTLLSKSSENSVIEAITIQSLKKYEELVK
ncbi:MAG TPA: hypothetical protein PLV83_03690 [Bacilli bacterium]|nr:hypothetical protein [Bacilli bacterium]